MNTKPTPHVTSVRDDLDAIAKGFPPHVRAEWERQQRVVRTAVAFVVSLGASDGDAALAELKAAVAGLMRRGRR